MSAKIVTVLLLSCISTCLGSEKELVNNIFKDYDKRVRPVRNASTITTVGVQIQIIRLLEVNGKEEYIKLTMILKQQWKDEYLTWDPKKYNGIEYMRLPASMVWLPDITIVTTSNEAEDMIPREDTLIGLHYTGAIDVAFAFVHYNACPMESQKFPFDSQKCIIKVAPWKHPINRLHLVHASPNNTKARDPNNEWEISPTTNMTKDWHRELTDELYRNVWYTVEIKRKSNYYIWVIIVPTFVINALNIAGIFTPSDNSNERAEKVQLGLTTLLTLSVILSLVTGEMPKGDHLPVLGVFVFLEIIICTSSMAVSVVILFLHQRAVVRGWLPPSIMQAQIEQVALRKKTYHYQYRNSMKDKLDWNENANNMIKDYNTEMNESMIQLSKALAPVNKYLEKLDENRSREALWAALFDRIDVAFLIGFQILNALALLQVFIGSF